MKQEIEVFDYAREITTALYNGVLLTTKKGNKINSMTIGWGMLGRIWEKPAFIAFVREGRFTREQLDATMELTGNIPYAVYDKEILGYCGSRTGKNIDKAKDLDLTLVRSDFVAAPGIKEMPLTLECKVVYRQMQDKNAIPEDIREMMYPENVDSSNPMANRDCHVAYYGQILKSYIIR